MRASVLPELWRSKRRCAALKLTGCLVAEIRMTPTKDGTPPRRRIALSDGNVHVPSMVTSQAAEQGDALTTHCIVRVHQYVMNKLGKPGQTSQCVPTVFVLANAVPHSATRVVARTSGVRSAASLLQGRRRADARGASDEV